MTNTGSAPLSVRSVKPLTCARPAESMAITLPVTGDPHGVG